MTKKDKQSGSAKLKTRAPVVAILGHVDHGKTTLLSKIKEINLTQREFGGITQHIGAYQVKYKGKEITFIDTPGHVAFSKMRSRGAKVADLVILVVAVDEGVRPQTLESLKHIQSGKIPYLVALTKIDLPNKNLERVKKDLGKNGIMVEGHGGEIVCLPVSAKTGQGVEDLLEMVLILGEMEELEGDESHPLQAVVIESKLDSRRGPLATILVQDGCLSVRDEIVVENKPIKVRAMFDEKGKNVFSAGPSVPVEILGFKEVPPVGSRVEKVEGKKETLRVVRKAEVTEEMVSVSASPARFDPSRPVEDEADARRAGGPSAIETSENSEKKLKIILKADATGTLEAIINSLPEKVQVIYSGVGNVNESDVLLADTAGAQIVAFNVKVLGDVKKLAVTEKVKIASFKVIYELLDEIEKKVLKLLKPTIDEKVLGRAEILEMFEIRKEHIAGCRVIEGEIKKNDRLHLSRKGRNVDDCRIKSMRTKKREIEKAKRGDEFGAILSPPLDFERGDMLVSFRKTEES